MAVVVGQQDLQDRVGVEMPTNKNEVFRKSFQTGLDIGASNFQLREKERIDIEKQQAKDREKRRIANAQSDALNRALGLDMNDPAQFDPLTKQSKRNAGKQQPSSFTGGQPSTEDNRFEVGGTPVEEEVQQQKFQRPPPLEEALLKQQMSPQGIKIFDEFVKRTDPSISDIYFGVKEQMHPDGSGGGLYGFDKQTGKKELIRDLPNYKFKPVTGGSYIIYGTADLQGETVGIKGRRTRVVELEGKGGFKLSDLGVIPRGSKGTDDEKTQLEFEIKMADVQNSYDALAVRKQQYITRDFSDIGGESSREDHRVGYNSAVNELALRTLQAGSDEAEDEGMRIWQQGRVMIRGGDLAGTITGTEMSREDYFDAMKDEVLNNMKPDGDWNYRDAQSIIKFLEFKYEGYLSKADSEADVDLFNSIELDDDGNIKQ